MLRFAANLSLMYAELPFLARFAAAARDGFQAVECLRPYDYAAAELAERLDQHGLQMVCLTAPAITSASLPSQTAQFRTGLWAGLRYAQALSAARLHLPVGQLPPGASHHGVQAGMLANLRWAAQAAADLGVQLLISASPQPQALLATQAQAHALVQTVAAPNLQVLMNLFDCQIAEGDLSGLLRRYLPAGRIGHLQIAGVPERQEPDHGELHYPYLWGELRRLDYRGWIGCAYQPRAATSAGLGWLQQAYAWG